MKIGIVTKNAINYKHSERIARVFADNSDFWFNRDRVLQNIIQILILCTKLHEIVGGKTQIEKLEYFSWQQNLVNGVKGLTNLEYITEINNQVIIYQEVKISMRILGVHICLVLCWNR